MNWSGGKDATLALYKIQQAQNYQISHLFTTVTNEYKRITMHGVREELLELQAKNIGISLQKMELPTSNSMENYNRLMQEQMDVFQEEGIQYSIFGDIYLEDLRQYREAQLQKVGMTGVFPLWKQPVRPLIEEFISLGFKAITVCVNARYLDESFVGRVIDENFINDLPPEVDVCGENGEFHTFVFDGPNFKKPVPFQIGEKVLRDYSNGEEDVNYDTKFYFVDLLPVED